jgi:predicted NBD/HSP70 family sugar kinase
MVISGNQQLLRTINRLAVLRAIRLNPGISRVQLADRLGLTRPTIGNLVDDLLAGGWLKEEHLGPTGTLGRRPVALHVNNDSRAIIGTDVNAERIICVATTLSGEVRELSISPTPPRDGEEMIDMLADHAGKVWQRLENAGFVVSGLGVGVPGMVQPQTGILRQSESTGWNQLPAGDLLKKNFELRGLSDIPILVQRAADCVAIYHFEFRRQGEEDPLLYVHSGQSITSAVASHYALLQGSNGTMGSVGHFILDPDGPPCSCGRHGCANVMATLIAVEKATGKPASEFRAAVQDNDQHVIAELQKAGRHFGVLLYNLCAQFDPARVFVGGPAFQSGPEYLNAAKQSFEELIHWEGEKGFQFEVVRHEINAVALGAATSVLHSLIRPL